MRARFIDCDIMSLSGVAVNQFQSAFIQNGVMDLEAIVNVEDYQPNERLNEIVSNYHYDEDAEDVMSNGIEFL